MSRTQPERSAATRSALTTAARRLWGERGYAAVGTPEIVEAAGVTRGAMYHQFADKAALFLAVVHAVEAEVLQRIGETVVAAAPASPLAGIRLASDAWLDVAADPEIRQLILLDAPAVLGWAGFRAVAQQYSLGMTEQMLTAAIDAGELRAQPVRPLATVLIGAMDEAAMYIAEAGDLDTAREEMREVLQNLISGLSQAHD